MKNPPLPQNLYKFLGASLSSTDDRIPFLEAGHLLRFTQPSSFNDAFEALPIWSLEDIDDDTIQGVFVGVPLRNVIMNDFQREKLRAEKHLFVKNAIASDPEHYKEKLTRIARKNAIESTGVLSLSPFWDSKLMWGHYSNNEGICIGFDTDHEFFKDDLDNIVYKVEYPEVRPVAHVSLLLGRGLVEILYENKSRDWEYEQEYRIVRHLESSKLVVGIDYRQNPIHLFEVPDEAVSEVVVGSACKPEIRSRVLDWSTRHGHVRIYEAFLSKTSYSLERRAINY